MILTRHLPKKWFTAIYNGSVNQRIEEAKELADTVGADGAVLLRTGAVRIQSVHQAL